VDEVLNRNESLSVRRSLQLLEHVRRHATAEHGVAVAALAQEAGVHRSTAARLLAPLVEEELLLRDGAGRYRLGPGALRLGQSYVDELDVAGLASPYLRELADRTGATCTLGLPSGGSVRIVVSEGTGGRLPAGTGTGSLLPTYCTALGKAVLSVAPASWIDRAIATGLRGFTPRTITDPTELRGELDRTRRRGFALDDREHDAHVRAVASPVLNHVGSVVAAVATSTDHTRMPPAVLRTHARATADIARSLSRAMGWTRAPHPLREV
jgi:DNA-binding IclR family transcriptional regulator